MNEIDHTKSNNDDNNKNKAIIMIVIIKMMITIMVAVSQNDWNQNSINEKEIFFLANLF